MEKQTKMSVSRWIVLSVIGMGAVVLVTAVVLGCRPGNPTLIGAASRPVSRIFNGFSYVGEDLPNKPKGAHVNQFLPVRLPMQSLPPRFVQGHDYFFHHPLPEYDGMRIAQEVLAPRLRKEGFTLTEHPSMGIFYAGFAHFDYRRRGGITVWAIQFKRDTCVGVIAYDSDFGIRDNPWPVVRKTWDPADYILNVQGTCNL